MVVIGLASKTTQLEASISDYPLMFSGHAVARGGQRNLSAAQVSYVVQYGKPVHRTGITFYILRRRDIPECHRRNDTCAKLEGTVVLVGDASVITVYRNCGAYHQVRKKLKYRLCGAA